MTDQQITINTPNEQRPKCPKCGYALGSNLSCEDCADFDLHLQEQAWERWVAQEA